MVIDLNRCVGCQTCTIACKHHNATTPDVQWRRVLDIEQGTFPDVQRFFMVTGCQHCEDAPCVPVCPTGATYKRDDGIVAIDYDQCIGCGYCAVSCPYHARTIVKDQNWYYDQETVQEQAVAQPERIGVAQKCTFCSDRVDSGLTQGLTPGVDPEATPACSASCIAQAITFGDWNDSNSPVNRVSEGRGLLQLNAETGTDPQIKYLYETPAVPGREIDATSDDDRRMDPANPLVGKRQEFWDWRAAMNWMLGGLSSGFAIVLYTFYVTGALDAATLARGNMIAVALMAGGLLSVFLKLGRPERSWRAILRPHSSWMTRELYSVSVFFPAVAAGYLWQAPVAFSVAVAAAAVFLLCQAQILYKARGIPAWRAPLIPYMIVASGLLEGIGLLAFLIGLPKGFPIELTGIATTAIVLIIINAVLWKSYRDGATHHGAPPLARAALAECDHAIRYGGHWVPLVLFALTILAPQIPLSIFTIAGVALIGGGAFWKWTVILRAGYFEGLHLPKTPQRGSGAYAAPARLDGWRRDATSFGDNR